MGTPVQRARQTCFSGLWGLQKAQPLEMQTARGGRLAAQDTQQIDRKHANRKGRKDPQTLWYESSQTNSTLP